MSARPMKPSPSAALYAVRLAQLRQRVADGPRDAHLQPRSGLILRRHDDPVVRARRRRAVGLRHVAEALDRAPIVVGRRVDLPVRPDGERHLAALAMRRREDGLQHVRQVDLDVRLADDLAVALHLHVELVALERRAALHRRSRSRRPPMALASADFAFAAAFLALTSAALSAAALRFRRERLIARDLIGLPLDALPRRAGCLAGRRSSAARLPRIACCRSSRVMFSGRPFGRSAGRSRAAARRDRSSASAVASGDPVTITGGTGGAGTAAHRAPWDRWRRRRRPHARQEASATVAAVASGTLAVAAVRRPCP